MQQQFGATALVLVKMQVSAFLQPPHLHFVLWQPTPPLEEVVVVEGRTVEVRKLEEGTVKREQEEMGE